MRFLILAAFCALALFSAGCSGERLDSSSDTAVKQSTDKMTAGMSEEKRLQFFGDCTVIIYPEELIGNQKRPATMSQMYKPLEGMTASEIHSKAEEVRARLPKKNSDVRIAL
jgi:hypothetical protein